MNSEKKLENQLLTKLGGNPSEYEINEWRSELYEGDSLPLWFVLYQQNFGINNRDIDYDLLDDVMKSSSTKQLINYLNAVKANPALNTLSDRVTNIPLHPSVFKGPYKDYNTNKYYYYILSDIETEEEYNEKKDLIDIIKFYLDMKPVYRGHRLDNEFEEFLIWVAVHFIYKPNGYLDYFPGFTASSIISRIDYIIEEGVSVQDLLIHILQYKDDNQALIYLMKGYGDKINVSEVNIWIKDIGYDIPIWNELVLNQI